ncbi:hypothetical protein FKM82_027128 [Ascaphus truei]
MLNLRYCMCNYHVLATSVQRAIKRDHHICVCVTILSSHAVASCAGFGTPFVALQILIFHWWWGPSYILLSVPFQSAVFVLSLALQPI